MDGETYLTHALQLMLAAANACDPSVRFELLGLAINYLALARDTELAKLEEHAPTFRAAVWERATLDCRWQLDFPARRGDLAAARPGQSPVRQIAKRPSPNLAQDLHSEGMSQARQSHRTVDDAEILENLLRSRLNALAA